MNIENIKTIFNEKKEVHFKLYSLDYTIKQDNNMVIVYADLYSNRKESYNSIDEALNYFTVYNESLVENQNRIMNIK